MNKTLIALLSFMGSVLLPVQAGESVTTAEGCNRHMTRGGDLVFYCSHHPLTREVIERLECMNTRCEIKKDSLTGDMFIFGELRLKGGRMGYQHVHDQ